jgi:hypothetical protein
MCVCRLRHPQVIDFARKQGLAAFSVDDEIGDQLIMLSGEGESLQG